MIAELREVMPEEAASRQWQPAKQSVFPGRTRPLKFCETCGKPVSRHGYTAERYERLVRFCSAWCRRNAPLRKVFCSRCGAELSRAYRTANPHCRPHCPTADPSRRKPPPQNLRQLRTDQLGARPGTTPAARLRHPFEPVVYRLALPVIGAEIDWTVYSPEGERKLREALVASPDDPDSIGPVFVLSVQRNLCQRGCSASIAG